MFMTMWIRTTKGGCRTCREALTFSFSISLCFFHSSHFSIME